MKKYCRIALFFCLMIVMALIAVSCGDQEGDTSVESGQDSSMEVSSDETDDETETMGERLLEYAVGMDDSGRYNTALFGKNGESDPNGADPGVYYVSREEDPVYGGYYYTYVTAQTSSIPNTAWYQEQGAKVLFAHCQRSTDLYHWEDAGALAGSYAAIVDEKDWCDTNFWAPEVIRNPQDGKYYMYFSANAKRGMNISYMSDSEDYTDRLYLGVAVSDTPVGPFDILYDVDENTGTRVPTINFREGFDTGYNLSAIDAHPFFDENGQMYLYFVRHFDAENPSAMYTCGMKMTDMAHGDYSTAVVLSAPDHIEVQATPGDALKYTGVGQYFMDENKVNEGPSMYKRGGKYYLTYSAGGYGNLHYSIHQAIGDSPLGPFVKLSEEQGNPVQNGGYFGDVHGTAHHTLVACGDELYAVYHRHSSVTHGVKWGRLIAVDRITFVTNEEGVEVMTSNGPSRTLTWLPESVSGYKNLAESATITATNGTGTEWLNDGVLPLYTVTADRRFSVNDGTSTITLRWDEPVSVSALMIYNAVGYEQAFAEISSIRFLTADGTWLIKDLPIQSDAWIQNKRDYYECAPAVAEFAPLTAVSEIRITVSDNDALVKRKKDKAIEVTEIVVLGNANAVNDYSGGKYSFSTHEQSPDIQVDGVLEEAVWQGKNRFENSCVVSASGEEVCMELTAIPTRYGIYVASVVYDKHLVSDGEHMPGVNSGWELYFAACDVGEDLNDANNSSAWHMQQLYLDMNANVTSNLVNIDRAVVVDDTAGSEKATMEMFIPWSLLGVDTSKGIPESFGILPYYCYCPGKGEDTVRLNPPVQSIYIFDKNGCTMTDPSDDA